MSDSGVLGQPIEVTDAAAVRRVELVRRAAFGGAVDRPRQHLGEAQTQYVLKEDPRFAGAIWVTDDRDAYDFGRRQQFVTWRTAEPVEEMAASGLVKAAEALPLRVAMRDEGRGVLIPQRPGWPS